MFSCTLCARSFVIKRKFKLHMARHRAEGVEGAGVVEEEEEVAEERVGVEGPADRHDAGAALSTSDSGPGIENIDPRKEGEEEMKRRKEEEEEEALRRKQDFIKAVKQLQELEESSLTCQHCGKALASRKAVVEHEVAVHGDLTNAEHFFR